MNSGGKQSKADSLMEAVTNIVIGTAIATLLNMTLVAWLLGVPISAGESLGISLIYVAASIVRQYILRRAFNGRTVWQSIKERFA